MKVLVTGAKGFVGRHLVHRLQAGNIEYESLVRTSQNEFDLPLPAHDVVVHLAGRAHILNDQAIDPRKEFFEANCDFAVNVARNSFNVGMKRFVYVSSLGVYGKSASEKPITEKDLPHPVELYAESKLEGERQLRHLSDDLGFELVIVRPALVYGYDAPGNIERILRFIAKNKFVPFAEKKNKRTFLSVGNFVDFLVCAAEHKNAGGETFNIADIEAISTSELCYKLARGMGRDLSFTSIPRWLWKIILYTVGKRKMYEQLFEDLILDSGKARSILGWKQSEPAISAIENTGQQFIQHQELIH